jgi:hypothetical protein
LCPRFALTEQLAMSLNTQGHRTTQTQFKYKGDRPQSSIVVPPCLARAYKQHGGYHRTARAGLARAVCMYNVYDRIFVRSLPTIPYIHRVGQNRIYTVYIRYFLKSPNIRCIHTYVYGSGQSDIYTVYIEFWPTLMSAVPSSPLYHFFAAPASTMRSDSVPDTNQL